MQHWHIFRDTRICSRSAVSLMVGAPNLGGGFTNGLAMTSNFIDIVLTERGKVQTQGRNIRHYTNYLSERARGFRETKCDYVQDKHESRLEKMSVDKGLLRETESVQHQVTALLKCDVGQKSMAERAAAEPDRSSTMSQKTRSLSRSFECL